MLSLEIVLIILAAYLIGSVPTAVWIGKVFYSVDVREHGSGNAGATNTFRVLGKRAGIPVLILDILKGFAAVQLAFIIDVYLPSSQQFVNLKLVLSLAVLTGHIFPVFAGFRGGKGVATLLGVLIGVQPLAALICAAVFLIIFIPSGFVSLSSMSAAFAYPFIIMLVLNETNPKVILFSIAIFILVLITHQKNIERLLKGTESKMFPFRRKAGESKS